MYTIEKEISAQLIEKKSRFIAHIFYVETREDAEKKIKKSKKKYHNAKHNCSAYIVFENGDFIEKSNDDGEPSGTAGLPILNILKKNNLCNILVIVTRYFGGILLGTSGLVKAYSDVTIKALEQTRRLEIYLGKQYKVCLDYDYFDSFKYYCKNNNIQISKTEYLEKIICYINIENRFINIFLQDIENRKINILEYMEICDKYIQKKVEEN